MSTGSRKLLVTWLSLTPKRYYKCYWLISKLGLESCWLPFLLPYAACSFLARCCFLLINPLNSVCNCTYFILLERQGKKMSCPDASASSSLLQQLQSSEKWGDTDLEKNPELCFLRANQQSGLRNGPVNCCVGITEGVVNWEVRIKKEV